MKHSYDYTPLKQDISYAQAKQELPRLDSKYKSVNIAFSIIVVVLAAMTIPGILERREPLWPAFLVLGPLMVVPYVFYRYHVRNAIRAAKLQRFAAQNNLTLRSAEEPGGMKGMVFETGHHRMVISAIKDETDLEIGTYRYVTGYGRASRSHHYSYMTMPLSEKMPNIVLDSKKNNTFKNAFMSGFASNAPEYIKKNQIVAIDSGFDTLFKTYVSDGGEAEARAILGVDTRHALTTYVPDWDIEIVGDRVVIFTPGQVDLTEGDTLRSLLAKAFVVRELLEKHMTVDTDVSTATYAVRAHPSGEQRLRRTLGWLLPAIVVLVIINLLITITTTRNGMNGL